MDTNNIAKKIIVYSTPTCPYCIHTKEYFTKNGIAFTDIDVSKDDAKAEEMIQKSGQMGVPVILVDDQMIVGFDQAKLEQLLGL